MQIIPGWHPAVVHFAVAASIIGCAAMLLSPLLPERAARHCAGFGTLSLCVGAGFCVLALATGVMAVWDVSLGAPARSAVSRHVIWAFFTTLAVLLLTVWRAAGYGLAEPPSGFMRVVAGAVMLAVLVTGWLGGENVYRYGIGVLRTPVPVQAGSSSFDAKGLNTWREQRLASLTGETGWLTPVALYWLKTGSNSFGRDAGNDFVLDSPSLPARAGAFVLKGAQVKFDAVAGSGITVGGAPARTVLLVPDTQPHPTELIAGSLHLMLIERGGRMGIRVRDSVSPMRTGFSGLHYFPVRPDWSVDARFEPYVPTRRIPIVNILGMQIEMDCPGALVFEKDGRTWRLDAVLEEPGDTKLFVMFADGTSGRESYGAGRFLYTPLPRDGHVRVDFNRAYNPPCAFTSYATCPLPPPQNHLGLRVEAGELAYVNPSHRPAP
ncbi:MAG: DUF1684 domain-containing protein [Proteobacteria bacterium]|nr:DUF1684 domain-containing protein [Pseudomonadota bacterium]